MMGRGRSAAPAGWGWVAVGAMRKSAPGCQTRMMDVGTNGVPARSNYECWMFTGRRAWVGGERAGLRFGPHRPQCPSQPAPRPY
jgi:hypothetical protein